MAEISSQAAAPAQGRRLRRDMGPVSVLFSSVGIVIGSGWLFGALKASTIAGPAALLAWLIGAVAILILGLNLAELGGMYSVAGGLARFPHFAFGSLGGFAAGWFYFLGTVTTAPIETEAVLTYASGYVPNLINPTTQILVWPLGYVVAFVLMLIFTLINVLGVRWMSEVNKYAVWWKIAIPLLAIVAIMLVSFHTTNFNGSDKGGFIPFGMKGVLAAVSSGGIIFAYSGFEGAVSFGAESRNPGRNIPFAVIGSMVVGFVIYMLLQIAFLGALSPSAVAHGWDKLQIATSGAGAGVAGPFAAIALTVGLGWLAVVLYIDAIVSPGGTGLLSIGTASRTVFALARNKYIPAVFGSLSSRGVPLVAILLAFILGLFVFGPFPSWSELVGFATSVGVVAYSLVPLSVGALRKLDPERRRPFKLPFAVVLAPLGFIIANELILFSGFGVVWKLIVAIIIGFILLALGIVTRPPESRAKLDWSNAHWIWPWLIGLVIISFLGSFTASAPDPNAIPFTTIAGGTGKILPFGWDILVLAVFSVAIYYLALWMKLSKARAQAYIEELSSDPTEALPDMPAH
ncbi:MAG: APC family permease [Candidatus Dormiibacterota bacterium]